LRWELLLVLVTIAGVQVPAGDHLIASKAFTGLQLSDGTTASFDVYALNDTAKPDLVISNVTGTINEVNFSMFNETLLGFAFAAGLHEPINASANAWYYNDTGRAFIAVFVVPSPVNVTLWAAGTSATVSSSTTTSTTTEFPAWAVVPVLLVVVALVAVLSSRIRARDVRSAGS
jgi:hypothetical protein